MVGRGFFVGAETFLLVAGKNAARAQKRWSALAPPYVRQDASYVLMAQGSKLSKQRHVAVVDFEHEQIHGRHVEPSACVAPAIADWVVGAPASDELALLHLIRFETRAEASIPGFPVFALHLEHDLGGIVHVVDVVGCAHIAGKVIAEVVCSGDHFRVGSIAAQIEPL